MNIILLIGNKSRTCPSVHSNRKIGLCAWKELFFFIGLGLGLILIPGLGPARANSLLFLSTQLTPFEEAEKLRQVILRDYPGEVDFQPNDNRVIFAPLLDKSGNNPLRPGLIGGHHGDFVLLAEAEALENVDDIQAGLKNRGFVESFVELAKLGRPGQYYVPWMQATYLMAANRRALKYLPPGADPNTLTYDQLTAWAANLKNSTGEAKLGFPIGKNGLMHRFIQGYLYPSFTGSTLRNFGRPEAEEMWRRFRELWPYVNKHSLAYSRMDEPLLSDDVWLAWDHTARIIDAFKQRPNDFVALPAPTGPRGRGFMVVLAGLAIPKGFEDRRTSQGLMEYLTRPEVQLTTLQNVGFFPVVSLNRIKKLPAHIDRLNEAVIRQATSNDAIPTMLPFGLGRKDSEFNTAYMATFSQIVLRGRDAGPVLTKEADVLRHIISETKVRCWPPDESSAGPCPVE